MITSLPTKKTSGVLDTLSGENISSSRLVEQVGHSEGLGSKNRRRCFVSRLRLALTCSVELFVIINHKGVLLMLSGVLRKAGRRWGWIGL